MYYCSIVRESSFEEVDSYCELLVIRCPFLKETQRFQYYLSFATSYDLAIIIRCAYLLYSQHVLLYSTLFLAKNPLTSLLIAFDNFRFNRQLFVCGYAGCLSHEPTKFSGLSSHELPVVGNASEFMRFQHLFLIQ